MTSSKSHVISLGITAFVFCFAVSSYGEVPVEDRSTKASPEDSARANQSTIGSGISDAISNVGSMLGLGGSDPVKEKEEAVPGGLASHEEIQNLVKTLYINDDPGKKIDNRAAVLGAYEKYNSNWDGCIDKQASAATWCLETNNTDIQTALSSINILASSSGLASVTDSCTTMGKVVNIGSAALTLYSAQCGVWRSACALDCVASRKGANEMLNLVTKSSCVGADLEIAACISALGANRPTLLKKIGNELKPKLERSIADKSEKCTTKYLALLGSAVLGAANLAKAMKDSKSCKDQSDGTAVATLAEKCADTANAALPECICIANPRTAGCSSGLSSIGELNAGNPGAVSPNSLSGAADAGNPNFDTSNGFKMAEQNANSSDSGGVGAPTGGGGSGLGGSGGGFGGGGPNKGDGKSGSGLNTNILGGFDGGGGGGSGYGGYGSDEKGYRKYLPGGANDPARGLAGQSSASKEVTSQGGKSNFEKVKDRYIDNKNSLLAN